MNWNKTKPRSTGLSHLFLLNNHHWNTSVLRFLGDQHFTSQESLSQLCRNSQMLFKFSRSRRCLSALGFPFKPKQVPQIHSTEYICRLNKVTCKLGPNTSYEHPKTHQGDQMQLNRRHLKLVLQSKGEDKGINKWYFRSLLVLFQTHKNVGKQSTKPQKCLTFVSYVSNDNTTNL